MSYPDLERWVKGGTYVNTPEILVSQAFARRKEFANTSEDDDKKKNQVVSGMDHFPETNVSKVNKLIKTDQNLKCSHVREGKGRLFGTKSNFSF